MRIAVFGAGAIGSYYGAGFARGGAEVHLIARGAHLQALRRDGLTLVSEDGTETLRLPATDDPAEVGPVDGVLVAVKSYDTEDVAAGLTPLLRSSPTAAPATPGASNRGAASWTPGSGATGVLSLQNGVQNEDVIASAVGEEHVLGGSAYIFATIRQPGVVFASGPRDIVIGEWSATAPAGRSDAIVAAARAGGIPAEGLADIRVAKWEKYTLLVGLSAMTAGTRLPLGELRRSEAAWAMLRALMVETWTVGRTSGVALGEDVVARQLAKVGAQSADSTSSLYGDLVSGHRMEVEALQGHVVRLARRLGVDTPFLDAAYAMLEPWALRNELGAAERPLLST